MTSSSPHLLPSKSCITGRVLLWYKHDHLLHVSFFLFFFVIHGCQGTLIKISIFLLVRIFFFFYFLYIFSIEYSVTWKKSDNLANNQQAVIVESL